MTIPKIKIPLIIPKGDLLDAAKYYVNIFGDGEVDDAHMTISDIPVLVSFRLGRTYFSATKGTLPAGFQAPTGTPLLELVIDSADGQQHEYYESKLATEKNQSGQVTDKFGLSWSIMPFMPPSPEENLIPRP